MDGYRQSDLVKVSILVNAESVDVLPLLLTKGNPKVEGAKFVSG